MLIAENRTISRSCKKYSSRNFRHI